MAEEKRIEGVYTLRIEQGPALKAFEEVKKRLDDTRATIKEYNKGIRDLIKQEREVEAEIRKSGTASDEQAKRLAAVQGARQKLNAQLSEAVLVERNLSAQSREMSNDLAKLTELGLRFRDKMAQATLEALNQSNALQQLGARNQFLSDQIQEGTRSLQEQEARVQELTVAYKAGAKTEEEYRAELDKLNAEIKASKDANEKLGQELQGVTAKSDKLESEIRQLNEELRQGKIDQAQYREGLRRIEEETRKAGVATDSLGQRFDKFASSQGKELKSTLSSLALNYVGVGAAIYGVQNIVGGAIDTIVEYNKVLGRIGALGGEYATQIDALGEAAQRIGPKFGVGPAQAAESIEALAKAGVEAEDIIGGALEAALTLAASGGLEAGQAAEYASSTMAQFGIAGSEAAMIADLLSAAANKAQGDVADFGNALKFVGPVAAANNIELKETVGTLALFAQNGILGEQAGTSLRGVLSSLTAPSKAATEQLKALGVIAEDGSNKLYDAEGGFLGLANMAGVLREATAGLTDEQRNQALGQIFGNQQLTAANILLKSGAAEVKNWTDAVNDSGIASRIASDNLDTLQGEMSKASAAWEAFVLDIDNGSGAISTTIRAMVQGFTKDLQAFTQATSIVDFAALLNPATRELRSFEKQVEQIREQARKDPFGVNSKSIQQLEEDLTKLRDTQAAFVKQGKDEVAQEFQPKISAIQRIVDARKQEASIKAQAAADAKAASDAQVQATEDEAKAEERRKEQAKQAADAERERIALLKELTVAQEKRAQADLAPQQREERQAEVTRDDRVVRAKGDAEALLQIENEYQAELVEIRNRYALERQQAEDASLAFIQQKRTEQAQAELAFLAQQHAMEIEAAVYRGEDITALLEQQQAQRAEFNAQIQQAEVDRINAEFEAQYAVLDAQGLSTLDLQRQHEEALLAMRNGFRQEDLNAQIAKAEAEKDLQEVQMQAIGGYASALKQLTEEGTAINKVLFAIEKGAAIADIVMKTQREIAGYYATYSLVPGGVAIASTMASAAKIRAGVSIATIAAQGIAGFAGGGEVDSTWGPHVRRSNGDNRLVRTTKGYVTLKDGEYVLNEDQQRRAEAIAGKGFWGAIGLPGFSGTLDRFRLGMYRGGYIEGGTIGIVTPRPTPAMVLQSTNTAALTEALERPQYLAVREYQEVESRVAVTETMRTL